MPLDRDVIVKRIDDVKWAMRELRRLASKEFADLSVDERYAIRYNIIVLVESLVSLCLHLAVEGFGMRPATYREAVRVVAERVSVVCMKDLESLIGLRNLLVHRYWVVDDEKVYQSVKANFKCVEDLLNRVEVLQWR